MPHAWCHRGGTGGRRTAGAGGQGAGAGGRVAPGTDLTEFGDPIDALEHVLAISHHMVIRLAGIVGRRGDDELAWRGRTGEQLRGEVVAAQRALADLGRIAGEAVRLGLAERRARIEERQVTVIENALIMALQASGATLEGQEAARHVLVRELTKAAG